MDGEIRATQRLGEELSLCVNRLTRKIQLNQFQIESLRESKARLEEEESALQLQIKSFREVEGDHKRQAAAIRSILTAKSAEFSEITKSASEYLLNVALQRENSILHERIEELKKKVEELRSETFALSDIDDAKLASQSVSAKDLHRRHDEAVARQQRLEAMVSSLTLEQAAQQNRLNKDLTDTDDIRKQEEALKEMHRILAERQTTTDELYSPTKQGTLSSALDQVRPDKLLTLLSVERDRERSQMRILEESLKKRIQRNEEHFPKRKRKQ